MYNLRPALPKYGVSWDPEILLAYLRKLSPVKRLTLKNLTRKAVALLWLLSGQRGQSVHAIDKRNLTVTEHVVKIRFGDLLKSSRPGYQQSEITLKAYAPDRRLCIVTVLQEYLKRTKPKRGEEQQLFISFQAPFGAVSKETIARWVRGVMQEAGLDISIFSPHSLRGASTSAASRAKVPIQTILQTAGWARQSTFAKYYKKPVKRDDFSTAVIQGSSCKKL